MALAGVLLAGLALSAPAWGQELVLSSTSIEIREGLSTSFHVKLSQQPSADVTVTVRSDNTDVTVGASQEGDKSSQLTLTFTSSNWETSQHIYIETQVDDNYSNDRAILSLTAAGGGYDSATGSFTVTVSDPDFFELSVTNYALYVTEGSSTTFTIRLTVEPVDDVVLRFTRTGNAPDVTFSTDAGTLAQDDTLTFTPAQWEEARTVTVTAADDANVIDETFQFDITLAGSRSEFAAVNVIDDDITMVSSETSLPMNEGDTSTFTVRLASAVQVARTVRLASTDDEAAVTPASLTFKGSDWSAAQTVTVEAVQDDDQDDGSATINLTGTGVVSSSLSVSVTDDEVGLVISPNSLTVMEGDSDTFSVKLAEQPPSGNRVVTLTSSNPDVTLSPASLTFTGSNWSADQTVTVTAGHDGDGDDDSATISLGGTSVLAGSVSVSVTEDDVGLTLSATSLTVDEQDATGATFTVKLSAQPSSEGRTVTLTSDNTDVTPNPTSLTFTGGSDGNWNTPQTVAVTAASDSDGADDSATITLAGDGITDGATVQVDVNDDDRGLTVSATSLDIREGANGTFTVQLAAQPPSNVTVNLGGTTGTDLTLDHTSLTFTNSNWGGAQIVTVTAGQDDDTAQDTATINVTATGGDYTDESAAVTVRVTDNDTAALVFVPGTDPLAVTEGSTATFTVKLKTQPSEDVTVTLRQPTNTDVTVDTDTGEDDNQNQLTFTTTDWGTAQTVTVSAA
ncbi:MAG: hypothetical protein ISN29_08565, partial [Gammaproteobacteria bacterium AqS3]|nr:hypothetical protein [Gammaproteobacteria bacterium AqS3]